MFIFTNLVFKIYNMLLYHKCYNILKTAVLIKMEDYFKHLKAQGRVLYK